MKKKLQSSLYILCVVTLSVLFVFALSTVATAETDDGVPAYYLYASEEAYFANPDFYLKAYQSSVIVAETLPTSGYMVCNKDVSIESGTDIIYTRGHDLTINLNGHTFSVGGNIQVGGNSIGYVPLIGKEMQRSYLNFKNGRVLRPNGAFSHSFQPRPGSVITFENCTVDLESASGYFFYDGGAEYILFKNCTVNRPSTSSTNLVLAKAACNYVGAFSGNDYVRNIVFDGTQIFDQKGSALLRFDEVSGYSERSELCNISFINHSAVDGLTKSFLTNNTANIPDARIRVFVENGSRLLTEEVSFNILAGANKVEYGIYESVEYVDHALLAGEKLEEYTVGLSLNEIFPYQICTDFCTVTLIDGEKTLEVYEGVACGVNFEYDIEVPDPYLEGGVAKAHRHDGWSVSADKSNPDKNIYANTDATFYAVINVYEPSLVAMDGTDIKSYYIGNEITLKELLKLADYEINLFSDVYYDDERTIEFAGSLDIDLQGYTFYKDRCGVATPFIIGEGNRLSIKNGEISSSMTEFAILTDESAYLSLENVDLVYDSKAPIIIEGGAVDIVGGSVTTSVYNSRIHAVEIGGKNMSTTLNFSSYGVADKEFVRYYACDNNTSINFDGAVVECEMLIDARKYVSTDGALSVNITRSDIKATGTLMCLPTGEDGEGLIEAAEVYLDSSRFSAPPVVDGYEVEMPIAQTACRVGDTEYPFAVMTNPNSMKYNLSLYDDMRLNFYMPIDAQVDSFTVRGENISLDTLPIVYLFGIAYYRVTVAEIPADEAADDVYVGMYYTVGGEAKYIETSYSVIDYLEAVMNSTEKEQTKDLCADIVRYIDAAYDYSMAVKPKELVKLVDSLPIENAIEAIDGGVEDADIGNLRAAISGAQLSLSSVPRLRFNLRSDFTGTLTINGKTYVVTDGKCTDNAYIELDVPAYNMWGGIIDITGATENEILSGSYSLSAYAEAVKTAYAQDSDLSRLLNAFLAYCRSAYAVNGYTTLPDDTPDLEIEFN